MQSIPCFPKEAADLFQLKYAKKFYSLLVFCLFTGLSVMPDVLAQDKEHRVKSGETLSTLARRYKTTVDELIRLNPAAAKGLKAGESLRLPGAGEKEVQTEPSASNVSKLHKVISGESLSRIAKKYKVSVSDLEKWNDIKAQDLKAGQEIKVSAGDLPEKSPVARGKEEQKESEVQPSGGRTHVVFKGETLSSIAAKEGSTVAELKKLNQLKKDQLNLGQVLQLPAAKISVAQPEKAVPKKEAEKPAETSPKKEAQAKTEAPAPVESNPGVLAIPASAQVNEIPAKAEEKPMAGIREVNNTLGYTRIVETGFAEAIEGDASSKKHLCLHKTAPVGSILQVKNEVNGQSVFVKVIGKLPETGSNEKIIIRISRQAYERLMASGKRFPVEVSYPEAQP